MSWRLIHADCIDAMAAMDEASVDAIVCDPPYGLEFMGKEWDRLGRGWNDRTEASQTGQDKGDYSWFGGNVRPRYGTDSKAMQEWHAAWATEALRVLKPGAHLLAFGGTRTFHRLACALEDAGFEIRDCLAWLYGSGFPKSLNLQGIWQGWGTALKPAFEPIVLARKPLVGSVATNVERFGTGALNIDGARIEHGDDVPLDREQRQQSDTAAFGSSGMPAGHVQPLYAALGRWPANVVLDPEAAAMLDAQTGELSYNPAGKFGVAPRDSGTIYGGGDGLSHAGRDVYGYGDTGGASRFFYCPKADREERDRGLEGFAVKVRNITDGHGRGPVNTSKESDDGIRENRPAANPHPTVKPVELMRWLVRLITPPGGTVLDPFTGSGSTGIAALREGFDFIGIEREADYVEIARARIQGDSPLFNIPAEVV